jgi:hypothetical protein
LHAKATAEKADGHFFDAFTKKAAVLIFWYLFIGIKYTLLQYCILALMATLQKSHNIQELLLAVYREIRQLQHCAM